eukprot:SAG31_NODE_736_length_12477_cov_60.959363_10_plen_326_part_00
MTATTYQQPSGRGGKDDSDEDPSSTAQPSTRQSEPASHAMGFILVTVAGCIWGGGALVAKYMVNPASMWMEYMVTRCLCISIVLLLYLLSSAERRAALGELAGFGEGSSALLHWPSLIGMVGIAMAMTGFVVSLCFVPAANTLCVLAAAPFATALLERFYLQVQLSKASWTMMALAGAGVLVIGLDAFDTAAPDLTGLGGDSVVGVASDVWRLQTIVGNVMAIVSAAGFAIFSVALRALVDVGRGWAGFVVTMCGAGVAAMVALLWLLYSGSIRSWGKTQQSRRNMVLSLVHGLLIGAGMVLYNLGAKHVSAAELAHHRQLFANM